jgi:peptidoglycan/xylan/chitin deacetylase (PgdA/CDA1 family)
MSDTYDDDLPYWPRARLGSPQLIIPYSLATNDMRFTTASGFANGEEYFQVLKDTFDVLWDEAMPARPR